MANVPHRRVNTIANARTPYLLLRLLLRQAGRLVTPQLLLRPRNEYGVPRVHPECRVLSPECFRNEYGVPIVLVPRVLGVLRVLGFRQQAE